MFKYSSRPLSYSIVKPMKVHCFKVMHHYLNFGHLDEQCSEAAGIIKLMHLMMECSWIGIRYRTF